MASHYRSPRDVCDSCIKRGRNPPNRVMTETRGCQYCMMPVVWLLDCAVCYKGAGNQATHLDCSYKPKPDN